MLVCLFACKKENKYIIKKIDFITILAEVEVSNAYNMQKINLLNKDSLNKASRLAILKHYNYTEAQYDSTIAYYHKHIFEYRDVLEEISKVIDEKEKQFFTKKKVDATKK